MESRSHHKTADVARTFSLPVLVARTEKPVIWIETDGWNMKTGGTSFLIGPRLVATVEYVVEGATSIKLVQGGWVVASGVVIGEDAARDVALVRTSTPIKRTFLKFASGSLALGESVAAITFPVLAIADGDFG